MVSSSNPGSKIAVIGVGGWGKNHAKGYGGIWLSVHICDLDLAKSQGDCKQAWRASILLNRRNAQKRNGLMDA